MIILTCHITASSSVPSGQTRFSKIAVNMVGLIMGQQQFGKDRSER